MPVDERLEHSGSAGPTTLAAEISPATTNISITDGTGFPTGAVGPFVVTLARGSLNEERIKCTSRSGGSITVAERGWDGTVARSHNAGATVEHTWSATEADQANRHTSTGTGVHGLAGDVVGTTDTQTLSNKTLTAPIVADFTAAQHDHGDADDGGNIPQSSVTGLVAGLATKASLTGAETLTNKTLTTPTLTAPVIADYTSAAHDHGDADDGGNIPQASVTGLVTALAGKSATTHTHGIDVPTRVSGLTARTFLDGGPIETLASLVLPAGKWLIVAECIGLTAGDTTVTGFQYDIEATTGTIWCTPLASRKQSTGLSNGAHLLAFLNNSASSTVSFTGNKLGNGAQLTNSTSGQIFALKLDVLESN